MFEVRVDTFSGWGKIEKVVADSFELQEGGILVFYVEEEEVMVFAPGKWVYVKKL